MHRVDEQLSRHLDGADPFATLRAMEGTVYRDTGSRRTFRFALDGKTYFAKLHSGVGWAEIIKNLILLRLPVIGAGNEWRAIQRLRELQIPTLDGVACGSRGWNPATRQSFIVTRELRHTISLEDLCRNWQQQPPPPRLRRQLIEQVATISRLLHGNGICHRDYYLCHFLLHTDATPTPKLSLIDLHRALLRKRLAQRWIVKDIAGLYYSAMHLGLSDRDLLRFVRHYSGPARKRHRRRDGAFWKRVQRRARRLLDKLGPAVQ